MESTKKNLYIKTFGCQMNEYDSLKLSKILENDYNTVKKPEDADLVLINTCSVRGKPEHKLYSLLGEIRDLKKEINKPDLMIGVGGCVAQQEGANIIKRSKDVDFVFGTHNLSLVPSLIEQRNSGSQPQIAVDYREEWEELPLGLSDDGNRISVFVSISRGCDKNCSYCIVPRTRGKEVSRASDEILKEVRIAVHRGAKEIVLLGQTVNSYGKDFSPRMKFSDLLNKVSEIDGVERIRFTSPHPQEVKKDFIDLVTKNPKISPHIHMPLQSGNNRILKAMNRNYNRERYLQIIQELKDNLPSIGITTDIIVGFPTETIAEFEDTLDIMDKVRFQNSYSYLFSPRPETIAAKMEDDIPQAEKSRRIQILQALQEQHSKEILEAYVGKEVEVLFDGFNKDNPNILQGRTAQNVLITMDKETPEWKLGTIAKVVVSKANRFSLHGAPSSLS